MTGRQESEAVREKHSALALKLLEDAGREIAAGDTVRCASWGLPHSRYAHRRRALLGLAERTGDGFPPNGLWHGRVGS